MPSLTKVQTGFVEAQGALPLSSGTAAAPGLKFDDHAGTGMFSPSTGEIAFSTSGHSQAVTFKTDGKVGIGTNNPARKLEIFDTAATVLQLNSTNSGGTSLRIQNSGTDKMYMGLAGDFIIGQGSNVTDSAIRASGSLLFASGGGTERLRITSDGNIGIGTETPGALLSLESTAANAARLRIGFDGPRYYDIYRGSTTNSGYLNFYGSQSTFVGYTFGGVDGERLRIDSSGQVILNNSASSGDATILRLTGGTSGSSVIEMGDTADTDIGQIAYYHGTTNAMAFRVNASEALRIASDGTILAGGQTSSYDGGFVNLELRKDSTTVGGSMTLVNGQSATAGATCQIDCYQNYRAAGRIVFGRENANNWQAAAGSAASFLSFHTNNAGTEAEKLRITSDGKVMMGKSSSSVNRNLSITGVTGNSNNAEIGLQPTNSSGGINPEVIIGATADGSYGAHMFFTTRNTSGNRIERLRITSNGNVGINQTNPSEKLEVYAGDILLSGNANGVSGGVGPDSAIKFEYNGHQYAKIVGNGRDSSGYGDIDFYTSTSAGVTNLTQRMTIRADGKIGIGDNDPSDALTVYRSNVGNPTGITIRNTEASSTYSHARLRLESQNGAAYGHIWADVANSALRIAYNSSSSVNINSTGDVGIGVGSPDLKLHVRNDHSAAAKIGGEGSGSYYMEIGQLSTSSSPGFNATGTSASMLFKVNGTEAIRLDPSGRLLVGENTSQGSSSLLQVREDSFGRNVEIFRSYNSGTTPGRIRFSNSRGTESSPTIVANGDNLAEIRFNGYDGTNYDSQAAKISVEVDGTPGVNDMPGRLIFATTANGSASPTERLRISSDGSVAIGADGYGNVAPLAKLHVSSTGTTTAIGSDHGNLRSSCQILCQASDNADNSKSGIMFSGALHSTDGCSAAVVATHESVGENSETSSLSFYTSHNETLKESLKITSDSQFEMNGVRNIYQSFLLVNNTTYNWDFTVPGEGGYGNSFYLVAGYNHYYTTSYGAHRTCWFSSRGTSVGLMGNGIEQTHSQSGTWTFSKPNSTTVRITKTGGTYGGSGYGFFHLTYNHF